MLMALAGVIPALGLLATAGLVVWAIRQDGGHVREERGEIDPPGSDQG